MSRVLSLFVVCAIAVGCGSSSSTPLAPSSMDTALVTAGGGSAAPQSAKKPAEKQVQLQGAISALAGTADAFTFTVKGRSVSGTTTTTTFKGGTTPSFAGLVDGKVLHVAGVDKGTYVQATTITFQEEVPPTPPGVVITGTLSAITGDVPALTLTVGTSTVLTTGATVVKSKSTTLTLAALVVGQKVEVTGAADVDGIITATRVQITAAAPPAPVVKFNGKGVVADVAGTCPAATFTLQGKTIVTRAATKYTKVTCATLAAGSTLQVTGTVSSDGSVAADTVKKIK